MQRHPSAARLLLPFIAVLAMVVGASGCERIAPDPARVSEEMSVPRARVWQQRLAAMPAEELRDTDVIALGYLERARLGLGSPFRLIDFALSDPDLDADTRTAVAYALLARVQEGRIYQIDPHALELLDLAGGEPGRRAGKPQLELIERVIRVAPSADSGERMVRLGYQLALAERTVSTSFPSLVAHVAALAADRRRAREDAAHLVAAARAARVSPLDLIPRWRQEGRFSVEAPAMNSLSVSEEEAVASQGPRVALSIRALAQRLAVPGTPGASPSGTLDDSPRSLLTPAVAARMMEIADQRNLPPQAPISVALLVNRDGYVDGPGASEAWRESRQTFIDSTWNEERLVAGLVLQEPQEHVTELRLRSIQLQAAVFFRVWNQEKPWFPGDPAPAAKDVAARFGLAGIDFGADVPESWQPYYRRMLAESLTDLQRILPTASVRGLRVRFAPLPGDRRALALHDPSTRTLYLPPRTGAGALAHEIAHDLDWQLARKRYDTRRGYATDLAVNSGRGDRIAYALSGLAASLTQPDSVRSPHDTRPTEVFARGTDWFVAATLAREGRMGGYLTSFQDPSLTGYGTTRGPDVGGGAVGSLLNILEAVAPVDGATAEWAVATHGPQRRLTPSELARGVASAGADLTPTERFGAIARTRDHSLNIVDNALCRMSSAEGLRRLSAAQRELIEAAAAASARGAAIEAGRDLGRNANVRPALVDAWMNSRLYGAPEPADSALATLEPGLEELVYRVRALDGDGSPELVDAFDFTPRTRMCGGNPFASGIVRRAARGDAALERR